LGQAAAKGVGRGIAAHFGYGSYVAQVAEVSCNSTSGSIRIHRVTCAIDCGTAVNPLGVQAQMEGAINFGLAAVLKSAITVNRGRVEQSNFHDYEVLRMGDARPSSMFISCPARNLPAAAVSPACRPSPRLSQCHFRGHGQSYPAAARSGR